MELSKQDRLIAVYEDTQAYYTENPTLAEAVKKSRDHTVFYPAPRRADDYPGLSETQRGEVHGYEIENLSGGSSYNGTKECA